MRRSTIAIAALASLGLGAGCATDGHVDEHWGESQRTLAAQQVEHPEASDEVRPVVGLGSATADHVTENDHERQSEQFRKDEQTSLLELIDAR
jgi:hypothetical protein